MLDFWLVAALFAFVAVMAVVLGFCFRERHLWHDGRTGADLRGTPTSERASDRRIAAVIFGAIIVGALLALLVGYLVFFSGLATD
jgi:membrane protein implicated in regulation of membrane protease activity